MREVYLTAGGMLTGAGSLNQTWSTLLAGRTALHTDTGLLETDFPLGIIPGLKQPVGTAARLDELLDHLFIDLPPLPEDMPLICASTKGAVDELLTDRATDSGQIWQLGEQIRACLELKGEASIVSAACASGTIAVIQAGMRISSGETDQALVVGLDILSHFVVGGFTSLQGLSPAPCRPFDQQRDGLSLGEGGCWLLLTAKRPDHSAEGIHPCRLESWSISCDATHITAPCRNASGLIRVLEELQSKTTIPIGGINAHGTGTVYNDAMELLAFDRCLPEQTPVCSVKGCIGHCLGGAGCIEIILAMKSLQENCLPPTVGLATHEKSNMRLSGSRQLELLHPSILSCNSGFGGINAAVLLSRL